MPKYEKLKLAMMAVMTLCAIIITGSVVRHQWWQRARADAAARHYVDQVNNAAKAIFGDD